MSETATIETPQTSAGADPGQAGAQTPGQAEAPKPSETPQADAEQTGDDQLRSIGRRLFGTAGEEAAGQEGQPVDRAGSPEGEAGKDASQEAEAGAEKQGGTEAAPASPLLDQAKQVLGLYKSHQGQLDDIEPQQALSDAKEKATQALKLAQWDDDLIAELPDEVLLRKGAQVRTSQLEHDRVRSEKERIRKEIEQIEAERAKAEPDNGDGKGDDTAAAVVDTDIAKLLEPLDDADIYSDPSTVKNVLTSALTAQAQQAEQRYNALAEQTKQTIEQIQKQSAQQYNSLLYAHDQMMFNQTAQQLTPDLPMLGKSENLKGVYDKVVDLSRAEGYHDANGQFMWDQAVRDAYQIKFGRDEVKRHEEDLTDRYKTQTGGQPGGQTPTTEKPPAAMTATEQLEQRLKLLKQGMTPEEIQKRFGDGRPVPVT